MVVLGSVTGDAVSVFEDKLGLLAQDANDALQDIAPSPEQVSQPPAPAQPAPDPAQVTESAFTEQRQAVAEETASQEGLRKALSATADANIANAALERTEQARQAEAQRAVASANQNVSDTATEVNRLALLAQVRAGSQRLAQAQVKQPVAKLNNALTKLKAFERNFSERGGNIAKKTLPGSDLAGETGRRRVKGDAPNRLTPDQAFKVSEKMNSIIETNALPPGQTITDFEIEDSRELIQGSTAGRKILDRYDTAKDQIRSDFEVASAGFNDMEDVKKFINDKSSDPLVADFAASFVAENLDEKTLARLSKNSNEKQMNELHVLGIRGEVDKAYKTYGINNSIAKNEALNLVYERDPANPNRFKRRSDDDIKVLVREANKDNYIEKQPNAVGADLANGSQAAQELVNEYINTTGNTLAQGDMTGYEYEKKLLPDGIEITESSDQELNESIENIEARILDTSGEEYVDAADITNFVDDEVERLGLEGDEAKAKANELGQATLDSLAEGSKTRTAQFKAFINERIEVAAQKLTSETTKIQGMSAADKPKEGLRLLNEAGIPTTSQFLSTKGQPQIHEMTKRIMTNELIKGTPLGSNDIKHIISQVDSLVTNGDPAEVQPDVLASYTSIKGLIESNVANAVAGLTADADEAQKKAVNQQNEQVLIQQEQQLITERAKLNSKAVAFSETNPTVPALEMPDTENGNSTINLYNIAGSDVQRDLAKKSFTDIETIADNKVTLRWVTPQLDPETGKDKLVPSEKTITPTTENDWDTAEAQIEQTYAQFPQAKEQVLRALREQKSNWDDQLKVKFGWDNEELNAIHGISSQEQVEEFKKRIRKEGSKLSFEDFGLPGIAGGEQDNNAALGRKLRSIDKIFRPVQEKGRGSKIKPDDVSSGGQPLDDGLRADEEVQGRFVVLEKEGEIPVLIDTTKFTQDVIDKNIRDRKKLGFIESGRINRPTVKSEVI